MRLTLHLTSHSIYDSAYWMDHFGDVTFDRHVGIAKILGLAALRLVDSPLLPLNVTAYASELAYYVTLVESALGSAGGVNLAPLSAAVTKIQLAAATLAREVDAVALELQLVDPRGLGQADRLHQRLRSINRRLQGFEGGFIDPAGLPLRTWYKNLVVARKPR